uniref:Ubiquitin-associated and SH3 domain-containing protein A n=1 Tax=Schistosoma haematobium TaxID=6185 RepID=A0A095C6H8_SCHHA
MADEIRDPPPGLSDLAVINRGQKIIDELKKSDFPSKYAISSRLNDPLFIKDFEVDFHVLLSLGGNFESDVSSFLSAARVALGWDYVCDHRAQIPLLHLRCLVLPNSIPSFLADVNVCVVSNPGKLNYPFTLVSGINNAEKNSVLIQLNEMYLSNHYIINEFDQSVNNQSKFCLYSHDPRLRDPSYEVFEMLTDVEFYPFSPLISSHITNDCNKTGDQKSSTFIACDTKLTDSSNDNHSQCDVSLNQVPACVINSPGCRERFLEHYVGDYILLFDSVSLTERQGCPVGINLCTGESGLFNISAGRRVPQSQTWTLHCSVPLNFTSSAKSCFKQHCPTSTNNVNYSEEFKKLTSQNSSLIAKNTNSTCHVLSPCLSNSSEYSSSFFSSSSSSSSDPVKSKSSVQTSITTNNNNNNNTDKHISDNRCDSYFTSGANSTCQNEFQLSLNNDELNEANSKYTNNYQSTVKRHTHNKSRQIYVMRHAERVDISFGHGWITQCFNHKGVYRRFNLNLPPWLPTRTDCLEYILDSPITQIGLFVSAETGRALADAGSDLSIRIEPHLFEWYGWYVGGCIPKMMTVHQLKQAGYNVDTNYTSLSSYNDNDKYESIQGYCDRTAVLIKRILNVHKSKDTCLLIVAHASSLDTCTRHLVCHKFRNNLSSNEFHHRTSIVPYCGLLLAQENRRWNLINPPIPNSCSYTRNIDFDWKQLLGPSLCNFKLR